MLMLVFTVLPAVVQAQIEEQCPHIEPLIPSRNRIERSPAMREQLIKLCIKENKKDFAKLVARTEEIAKLTDEIKKSFDESKTLSNDDREKLERVEDLIEKVRDDLRVSGKGDKDEGPKDVVQAVNGLQETASELLAEIKKATRHTISLVAVESSNAVRRFVKFLRFGN